MAAIVADQHLAGTEEVQPAPGDEGAQRDIRFTSLPDGGFVALWSDPLQTASVHVVGRRYDANGRAVGDPFVADSGDGRNHRHHSLDSLVDGGFVVAWSAITGLGSDNSFEAQLFNSAGQKVGGILPLHAPVSNLDIPPQVIGLASGGFVLVWGESNGPTTDVLRGQVYSAAGAPLGGEFEVETGYGYTADVAALSNGGFVVVWDSLFADATETLIYNLGVRAQIFNAAGARIGDEIAVNSAPQDEQIEPVVAALPGGGFVVAWMDAHDTGGTAYRIKSQRFDSAGARVGAEIAATPGSPFAQMEPTVAAGADGRFVIGWTEVRPTNDGDVMGRLFDSSGAPVGDAFDAALTTAGTQQKAGSAMLASGGVVLGWTTPDGGGSDDVRARVFFPVAQGSAGVDVFAGTAGRDFIAGLGHGDQFSGGLEDDGLYGGDGDDSLYGGDGNDELDGGDGNDLINAGSGDDKVTGGDGADSLRLYDGGGDDIVLAGAGNDTLFFGGSLTEADVVDGGGGTDTLVLQGPYGALALTANVTRIENISILGGGNGNFGDPGTNLYDYVIATDDSNFAAGVQARINGAALLAGEDFTFDGSAETDAGFVIYGGRAKDNFTGGLGNDIFFFAEERFASGDVVNGGPGYDGMFLRGNYSIDFNAPGYAGLFTSIENLTLTSVTDERYARGGTEFDYNIILSNALVGAGAVLTVSGTILTADETMILDGSLESDGNLRLFGGKAGDTMKGGGQDDLLHGNLGADTLAGGGGADTFRYDSTAESNSASRDQILDFTPGTDRIDLSRIDARTDLAGDQAFSWIGSGAFSGTAGQLRTYEQNGTRFVEGDVNGDGVADLVIALTPQGPTPLRAGDFLL